MSQERWTAVDRYITDLFVPPDDALEAALRTSEEAGLPRIQVAPNQGKLLGILARAIGARRILEIGTLGAYSTIWMGRALPPDGELVTLEVDPKHAEVARANLERAGLSETVEVRAGPALETLPELSGPFDLVFIDADKENTASYFRSAVELTRPGGLIVTDNVIRDGEVADPGSEDPRVQGIRRFHEAAASEPRVSATAVQTVGSKGYDGLSIAVVLEG